MMGLNLTQDSFCFTQVVCGMAPKAKIDWKRILAGFIVLVLICVCCRCYNQMRMKEYEEEIEELRKEIEDKNGK